MSDTSQRGRADADDTRGTCPYCGVGCGVTSRVVRDRAIVVRGDSAHPANLGRLCAKGLALAETTDLQGRLLYPDEGGRRIGWPQAVDRIAQALQQTIDEHGREAVAFYVSGQLLTEDYYVVNKFVKGWLGTAHIDTNSRLCMASSVAGHRRAFGSDTVPGCYEDLELADRVVLVGANLAWCHPVLFQRLTAARLARPGLEIVTIDPRRTATAELSDRHLPIRPDTDADLFGGLLHDLGRRGDIDGKWVALHTDGLGSALDAVSLLDIDTVAARTGLEPAVVADFYRGFRDTPRTVTVFSQGVNQGVRGTDTVNAIINCHLATGRIGKPGTGPFSVTGQPNAMGGREVGGLANMLAAHMALENPDDRDRVQRFWRSPRIAERAGPKAVELFERVAAGQIRFLWIMATNPVDSLPDADTVARALDRCPFVVVSDVMHDTDTARHAELRLPALAWAEKDGTVTNSERCVSRQRAVLPPPGEARPDWWAMVQVARRLGHGDAFDYQSPADIFREHAALSGFENAGSRDFDIGGVATVDDAAYATLEPFVWPRPVRGSESHTQRFFAAGDFFTFDRRARFVPLPRQGTDERADAMDAALVLNTGRIRDQWHTMTRTGRCLALGSHIAEPFVELHPDDARAHGIRPADLVDIHGERGYIRVRAQPTDRQRRGSLFVPIHWTDRQASRARVATLVPSLTDPHSGQPASKSARVSITRFAAVSHAFVVGRTSPSIRDLRRLADYWAIGRCPGGFRLEVADQASPASLHERLCSLLQAIEIDVLPCRAHHRDTAGGHHRTAAFAGSRLAWVVMVADGPVGVSRSWLVDRLTVDIPAALRTAVLAGRAASAADDPGAIVCGCGLVGRNTILHALRRERCRSVEDLGRRLGAGSHCGSCRGELARLVADCAAQTLNRKCTTSPSAST